jgi:hypothetical protein
MALRYSGIKYGTVCIKQDVPDGPAWRERKFNIEIRQANCLCAFIFVRKATEEELKDNPKGKWLHQLYSFFVNAQHIKNIMTENGGKCFFDEVVSIRLNMFYKESWTLLKYFTKSGYKVTCYYKEEYGKDSV